MSFKRMLLFISDPDCLQCADSSLSLSATASPSSLSPSATPSAQSCS